MHSSYTQIAGFALLRSEDASALVEHILEVTTHHPAIYMVPFTETFTVKGLKLAEPKDGSHKPQYTVDTLNNGHFCTRASVFNSESIL